jgi:hypothetical protein
MLNGEVSQIVDYRDQYCQYYASLVAPRRAFRQAASPLAACLGASFASAENRASPEKDVAPPVYQSQSRLRQQPGRYHYHRPASLLRACTMALSGAAGWRRTVFLTRDGQARHALPDAHLAGRRGALARVHLHGIAFDHCLESHRGVRLRVRLSRTNRCDPAWRIIEARAALLSADQACPVWPRRAERGRAEKRSTNSGNR